MSLIETAVPPTPDVSVLMAAPGKASAARWHRQRVGSGGLNVANLQASWVSPRHSV